MNVPVAAYSRFSIVNRVLRMSTTYRLVFYAFPFNFLEVLVLSEAIKRAVRILWGKHFAISWSHKKSQNILNQIQSTPKKPGFFVTDNYQCLYVFREM